MKYVAFIDNLQSQPKILSYITVSDEKTFQGIWMVLHYFKRNQIDMHIWNALKYATKKKISK